jgi:hypothetical protein
MVVLVAVVLVLWVVTDLLAAAVPVVLVLTGRVWAHSTPVVVAEVSTATVLTLVLLLVLAELVVAVPVAKQQRVLLEQPTQVVEVVVRVVTVQHKQVETVALV